jgi:hypothetical protein
MMRQFFTRREESPDMVGGLRPATGVADIQGRICEKVPVGP